MSEEYDEQYLALIRKNLHDFPEDGQLGPDTDLFDAGLDSTGLINLVVFLEDQYDISFPDDVIQADTFSTPALLWRAILELQRTPSVP